MPLSLPKAELHNHLEGTAGPDLVRRLAARHGMALPETLFTPDGRFAWRDFPEFLRAYDMAAATIRTAEDYRDVTYDYLRLCAEEGAIYVELMSSPDHAALAGLDYLGHVEGTAQGIEEARRDFGIEARIVVTCVSHFGPERSVEVAKAVARHPHPLVTGFGMGGAYEGFPRRDYRDAFLIARDAGLGLTVHAGETTGAETVWDAIDHLPVTRIGHGVRSAEDPRLVATLAERGLVLEVCPTSNVALHVYPDYAAHPLNALRGAGVKVTLNSDDPPYFGCTVGGEYAIARRVFGLTEADLLDVTRTAIEAAFVDEATRARLLARVDAYVPAA